MLNALLALTKANALDVSRRGGTLVLAALGVAFILTLRWFSAFGLGYEVIQLKELAVYTVGLMGSVAVLLFSLPGEDDSENAEALLLTRPVPPWVPALGTLLGRLIPLALLCALWLLAIYVTLQWFEWSEPMLFGYVGAESAFGETASVVTPVFGQFMACAILMAFVQPFARFRRPIVTGLITLGLYVGGYAVGAVGGWPAALLPDLGRHDLTAVLWGGESEFSMLLLIVHACAWCAAGVALDSLGLTVRSVA